MTLMWMANKTLWDKIRESIKEDYGFELPDQPGEKSEVVIKEYVAYIKKIIDENADLTTAMFSIEEYWNRDPNEQAMKNALEYIIDTANEAINKTGE